MVHINSLRHAEEITVNADGKIAELLFFCSKTLMMIIIANSPK